MKLPQQTSLLGTPKAEIEIDTALVLNLLKKQHPDLIHLPISLLDAGWDNVLFRLGDCFLVRLPRRKAAAALIINEQTWLPQLAEKLPLPIPVPCRIGHPTANYPWRWSIIPWLTGVTADRQQPNLFQAKRLASFLRSLHFPAPSSAPANPVRGVALKQRSPSIKPRLERLKSKTDLITPQAIAIWHRALNAPIDVSARWLHGDLHPGNILVENGTIVGIIDWGDLTSGDIATDLASIWMLFSERATRQQAIAEYGNISKATLQRAKGWAFYFAVVLLDVGLIDCPRQATVGEKTLRHLVEDELNDELNI